MLVLKDTDLCIKLCQCQFIWLSVPVIPEVYIGMMYWHGCIRKSVSFVAEADRSHFCTQFIRLSLITL